jgi:hypothetical protein
MTKEEALIHDLANKMTIIQGKSNSLIKKESIQKEDIVLISKLSLESCEILNELRDTFRD